MASVVVWTVLAVAGAGLGVVGACFSLRTLRLVTGVAALAGAVAVTQYGLAHPGNAAGDVVSAFLRGTDAVTVALLRPLGATGAGAPGAASRWVTVAVLLVGYRQLEAWARRWQAPELDLSALGQPPGAREAAPGAEGARRHAELAAALRFRLPAMEIRSPSILPGGSRTSALASIAESSGVSGAGLASALIRLASLLWPGPQRLRVRVWTEPLAGPGTRVTVLLEDARTGQTMSTKTVAGEDFQVAASMAAGYIARQFFAMDRTVPTWCYGAADGRDLGAMQLARMERVHVACPGDVLASRQEQIRILGRAMGSRSAGVARYELAQLCSASEQHLEALRLHAQNRELHPRLFRGRYRLAMSLEMAASPGHYLPDTGHTRDCLEETLAILCRCGLTGARYDLVSLDEHEVSDAADGRARRLGVSPDLSRQLLDVAARDLREVRAQLSAWRVTRDALLRRDERPVWLPHWRQQHRQPFQDGVRVAELLVAARRQLVEREIAHRAVWAGQAGPADREPAGPQPSGARRPAGTPAAPRELPRELRRAVKIASFVAGDPRYLTTVLTGALARPAREWPPPPAGPAPGGRPPADRVRWLPWQRRTASWQAAYNTACLYAALAAVAPEPVALVLEDWVITSLRRAIGNPLSELERPSDWISHDLDFRALSLDSTVFEKFARFVGELDREDYPAAYLDGECPAPPPDQARGRRAGLAAVT
jgi:hypothetical protein